MSPRHTTAHIKAIQTASLTSDTCKAMCCVFQALLCLGSRPLCVVSLHLPCISLGDHLSLLAGEGRSQGEAKHQGNGTAQQVLSDFVRSRFTVPEEGPGGWKEQRQASFSRSPASAGQRSRFTTSKGSRCGCSWHPQLEQSRRHSTSTVLLLPCFLAQLTQPACTALPTWYYRHREHRF